MNTHVQFEVVTSAGAVDAWSDERVSFDPAPELRDLRDALDAGIRGLAGPALEAWLAGPRAAGPDMATALLYNLGWQAFADCCRQSLRIERRFTVAAAPSGRIWRWHYHYQESDGSGAWEPSLAGTEVHMQGKGSLPQSPELLWAQAHRGRWKQAPIAYGKPLFLKLRVQTPTPVNLVNVSKLLVDSVCSSFHSYEGVLLPEVARRAADASGEAETTVTPWLARAGPLGPARFVWPYGSRLRWSPEDDRLVALQITGTATGKQAWTLDAGLYEALPL